MILKLEGNDGKLSAEQLELGQRALDSTAMYLNDEIEKVKGSLNVSERCAQDVVYLRTRSRHTPELERRLIEEHSQGKTINIMDWPKEP